MYRLVAVQLTEVRGWGHTPLCMMATNLHSFWRSYLFLDVFISLNFKVLCLFQNFSCNCLFKNKMLRNKIRLIVSQFLNNCKFLQCRWRPWNNFNIIHICIRRFQYFFEWKRAYPQLFDFTISWVSLKIIYMYEIRYYWNK